MGIFHKLEQSIEEYFEGKRHSHTHPGENCAEHHISTHRFQSFAPQSRGNAKWYVDGCSYFWAVSEAIEQATESIYILDWWLSPELYLRRPPSANEQYRLDNMLKAAAERGVKVHVIVYKEVEKALTLNSAHTKQALEALNPNIGVFRHPDHAPSKTDIASDLSQGFKNLTLNTFSLSQLSHDTLKALYGTSDDVVLFWAHHEKLLVVDRRIAFMGGLDACFGRWDTNSHPIADAHPEDLDKILFPGQDYNNARVMDFANVDNWNQNKLDRTKNSRMGWSDVSMSLNGPIVDSLVAHFTDRWNYIFTQKYNEKDPGKYQKLEIPFIPGSTVPAMQTTESDNQTFRDMIGGINHLGERVGRHMRHLNPFVPSEEPQDSSNRDNGSDSMPNIQLTRSCTKWSSGHETEHSIANAYIHAIASAKHFIYIENQFFITATGDEQHPVYNKIGAALAERIVRAHEAGERFHIMVSMPAVPAFAGDLKSDDALGTRAIMEYQYNSISRGGHSIMDKVKQAGVERPEEYISFYNLRNYDRINTGGAMGRVSRDAGVSYEDARREHDDAVGAGYYPGGEETGTQDQEFRRWQSAAQSVTDATADTVSPCYMLGSQPLTQVAWTAEAEAEMDAYVSEELYIHTKLLIADDRLVICGSANLNDRSQLGTHDSEIAVVIEDPTPVQSQMNGEPYTASRFAASLRRQIFRKHLGLLPDQRWDQPNANFTPVTAGLNEYDWGSDADRAVADPLGDEFTELWARTARTNTEVFSRAFHNVPNDAVRSWDDYDKFYSQKFLLPEEKADGEKSRGKVPYGHVVRDEFPGGVAELKEWLGRVRGNIVEMPLQFLIDVKDLAKEGLTLNGITDELYT